MTGWRLGYLAAHPDIVKAVSKIQSQTAPSSISQAAGLAFTPTTSVHAMRDEFSKRRDFMNVIKCN